MCVRACPTPKPPTVRESHERRGAGGGGVPGSKEGRGPGSWCSSACTRSKSVGIPRASSPQRARTLRIFPKKSLRGNSCLSTAPTICDPSDHLQESPGPPGPKSQKSLKKSLGGLQKKSPRKYPKKSKQRPKKSTFGYFFDFFRYFWGLFCRPPKRLFLRRFLRFWAWRTVNGRSGRNPIS